MKRLATIAELRPGMRVEIMGKTMTVHDRAHFWEGDPQGKGFLCVRDDGEKTAEAVTVYRVEKMVVE